MGTREAKSRDLYVEHIICLVSSEKYKSNDILTLEVLYELKDTADDGTQFFLILPVIYVNALYKMSLLMQLVVQMLNINVHFLLNEHKKLVIAYVQYFQYTRQYFTSYDKQKIRGVS